MELVVPGLSFGDLFGPFFIIFGVLWLIDDTWWGTSKSRDDKLRELLIVFFDAALIGNIGARNGTDKCEEDCDLHGELCLF